jgi:hypothetical protein
MLRKHALRTNAYNIPLEVMTKFKIFIFQYVSQSAFGKQT